MAENSICLICKCTANIGDSVMLQSKGCETINKYSTEKGDDIEAVVGSRVHLSCRKRYTDNRVSQEFSNSSEIGTAAKRNTRASQGQYESGTDCLFCGTFVDFSVKSSRLKASNEPQRVRTSEFSETIRQCCRRRSDEWSFIVLGRVEYFLSDLHAADCVHHNTCSNMFRAGLNMPQKYQVDCTTVKKTKVGKPENDLRHLAFLQTCDFLVDNDEEQLTINDLVHEMEKYLENEDVGAYNRKYMKQRLIEYY